MDIRRFLAELKGRGVYRVAAFYSAGSWALLQVADVIFPILGLPDWGITTVLVAAAIGFPIAIALAWIFEITPEGIVETDAATVDFGRLRLSPVRVVELGLLIALVCLVGFLYLDRLTEKAETPASAGGVTTDSRPSVAVMAFENMSDDPSVEYFGNGLAEEILNLLAKLNELRVAARTSSFYYKGKDVDLREVGQSLGVQHVLEGSVRRAGNRVRVTAQLIEMDSGSQLWSETYDRDYSDSFLIQDEIARQVVSNLKILLSSDSQQILDRRPDLVPEAYDYYLRGRDYLRDSGSDENARSAVELFSKAVALDANYAEAHAGLCDAKLLLYRSRLDPKLYREAENHCQKALEIDREALPVYVALGNLYAESGAYDRAIQSFRKALEINPVAIDALVGLGETYSRDDKPGLAEEALLRATNVQTADPRSFVAMGNFLFRTGRAEEAIPYYRRITELMPDNAEALNGLGAAHYMLGQFESAATAFQRSLELSPSAIAYSNAGTSLFFLHRFEEAVTMYLKAVEYAPEDFQNWGSLGDAYRHAEGLEELAEPIYRNAIKLAGERLAVNPSDAETMGLVAHYQASVGDREQALQNIARARVLAPSNLYVHYNAETAYCALGDRQRAAKALEQALEMGYSNDLAAIDANLCSLTESKAID